MSHKLPSENVLYLSFLIYKMNWLDQLICNFPSFIHSFIQLLRFLVFFFWLSLFAKPWCYVSFRSDTRTNSFNHVFITYLLSIPWMPSSVAGSGQQAERGAMDTTDPQARGCLSQTGTHPAQLWNRWRKRDPERDCDWPKVSYLVRGKPRQKLGLPASRSHWSWWSS